MRLLHLVLTTAMALAGGDRIVAGQAPTSTATTAPGVIGSAPAHQGSRPGRSRGVEVGQSNETRHPGLVA